MLGEMFTLAVPDHPGAQALYERLANELDNGQVRVARQAPSRIAVRFMHADELPRLARTIGIHVAEFIIQHMERDMLARLIRRQHSHYTVEETEEILDYCQALLGGGLEASPGQPAAPDRRTAYIADKAERYLLSHLYMDVAGFQQFRLGGYLTDLQETVEYAIDEYLSNRQYEEFVGLLKYFVYFQETKVPEIHLIHRGGNKYTILDDRLMPIALQQTDEVVMETIERELNYEDVIVSTLISASPEHITIHTREPETLSIKTVQHIFESRTTLCTHCPLCGEMLDGRKADGVQHT